MELRGQNLLLTAFGVNKIHIQSETYFARISNVHVAVGCKFAVLDRLVAFDDKWGSVSVYDLDTGQHTRTISTGYYQNTDLVALPNNKLATCGTNSHVITIWDVSTGKCFGKLIPFVTSAHCLHLAATLQGNLITHHVDGHVRVWNIAQKAWVATTQITGVVFAMIALSEDKFVCGFSDGKIQVRGFDGLVWTFASLNTITALVLLPTNQFAAGDSGGMVSVWDFATGAKVVAWQAHSSWIASLVCVGWTLVSASRDKTVKVWT